MPTKATRNTDGAILSNPNIQAGELKQKMNLPGPQASI